MLLRIGGWVGLYGWFHTWNGIPVNANVVTYLSTNRAWHRVTLMMHHTTLPLCHGATCTPVPYDCEHCEDNSGYSSQVPHCSLHVSPQGFSAGYGPGMTHDSLDIVSRAVIIAKLTYAASAWWGYASAADSLPAYQADWSLLKWRTDSSQTSWLCWWRSLGESTQKPASCSSVTFCLMKRTVSYNGLTKRNF